MVIFDSVLKKKVEFIPQDPQNVKIYVCGPTVYDDAHLGHAKSSVSFDLLRRVLIALGYGVKFVKNYTDIDDKILKKMEESGKNLEEITNFYIKRYDDDMCALGVLRPDIAPLATQTLDEIIDYISALEKRNFTYTLSDGVYFDTTKDSGYFAISGKNDENNVARVQSNSQKRDAKDFVLWKFDDKFYPSPFGRGRPGWHSECVAMIQKYLDSGDKFSVDIHAGGADLLFPHHENEAAQCRCAHEKPLAKYWLHNGFVQVDNEKMSKSLGNSFFIKDALKIAPAEVLRLYLLSSHYRANFNYSTTDLLASKKRLDKIYRLKKRLGGKISDEISYKFQQNLDKFGVVNANFKDEILSALSDDLNSSLALSCIDAMVNSANLYLDQNPKDRAKKSEFSANLAFVAQVLGIGAMSASEYFKFGVSEDEKEQIKELILQRNIAKKERNFVRADEIRNQLNLMNITIMDTPNGVEWERICEI